MERLQATAFYVAIDDQGVAALVAEVADGRTFAAPAEAFTFDGGAGDAGGGSIPPTP